MINIQKLKSEMSSYNIIEILCQLGAELKKKLLMSLFLHQFVIMEKML